MDEFSDKGAYVVAGGQVPEPVAESSGKGAEVVWCSLEPKTLVAAEAGSELSEKVSGLLDARLGELLDNREVEERDINHVEAPTNQPSSR